MGIIKVIFHKPIACRMCLRKLITFQTNNRLITLLFQERGDKSTNLVKYNFLHVFFYMFVLHRISSSN